MEDGTAPAKADAPVLETRDLVVRFGDHTVLDHINIKVGRGEVFVVMGPSGCGKTTLLKCLVGLLRPTEGQVFVRGEDLHAKDQEGMEAYHRATGMVFQGGALLNSISCSENVALPMRVHLDMPTDLIDEAVRMKLAQVGLLHAEHLMPSELSGGMRKRAGIARALALDPGLVYYDEPTSGLDPVTAAGMDELVLELKSALGVTQVVVTHDLPSAERIADHLVVLSSGEALVDGTWDDAQSSTDPRVRDFLDRVAEDHSGNGGAPLPGLTEAADMGEVPA
ncbi:MAG: ABC transporter ATP-binding protein [Planctomycetota bacterium]|jgi:phospholipid/cholesterol/gamma-HCH transport system ATP-binding protein